VVEVEQVVARVDQTGKIDWIPTEEADIIESQTVGFKRSYTLPYEVHFMLNVPRVEQQPFTLQALMKKCTETGMHMGGWFVSKKEGYWSFKSNQFESGVTKEVILSEWKKVRDLVTQLWKGDFTLTCLTERILGVWNAKKSKLAVAVADVKDADELAFWERNIPDLREMWVVTPNFLGDKSEVVFRSMISNLQRRVRYRYFVNSFADACRWQQLVKTLLDRAQYSDESLQDLMSAVILWRSREEAEYFIAITGTGMEGYCLKRLKHGEVYEGELMLQDQVEQVVESLKVLIGSRGSLNLSGYLHAPLKDQKTLGHVVRIRFPRTQTYTSDMIHLREYKIGDLVSKHGGEFSTTYYGDYLCVFFYADSQDNARKFYRELIAHPVINEGKGMVAFHPGYISRKMHVKGFEFVGPAVEMSKAKLDEEFAKLVKSQTAMKKPSGDAKV